MGTSSAYGGPDGGTPLVPSWLAGSDNTVSAPEGGQGVNGETAGGEPAPIPSPPILPAIPAAAATDRFITPRTNFSRFARSGGSDRVSLGRAVSNYVSSASGGNRAAAQRMGASRTAGSRLLGFLSGAAANGPREALRALNLQTLAGRPIEEVFVGLVDYVCPDGGTIDEGIAREAFIETIVDLAENGITDFDGLTAEQIQTIFELYVTHAIEARVCNDIGTKAVMLPADALIAANVQTQLFEFIRRSVADALSSAQTLIQAVTPDRALGFVTHIYEEAFSILQTLGDAEAESI
jgi:hypothetical protein